jgi:hypothetical protein
MKKITAKDNPRKKSDTEKRSDQDSSRSNVENKKSNLSQEKTKEKASQAGFSEQGSNERPSPIDANEMTAGVP